MLKPESVRIIKKRIPHKPGIYIFLNNRDEIIYVGKAIDLFHRVSSYFAKSPHDAKTTSLIANIYKVKTVTVSSEVEALILEANLIKKYRPKYNIKLLDDKDYLYIKITKEQFPKILTARKPDLDNSKAYFGPFPSGKLVKETLKKLRRIFPWCNNQGTVTGKTKACFYYHLNLCPGSCIGQISAKDYMKIINKFTLFMSGKSEKLKKDLNSEMLIYSKNMEYEKASAVKKMLENLNYLTSSSNINVYLTNPNYAEDQNQKSLENLKEVLNLKTFPEKIECYDISNISGEDAVGSLVTLIHGEIDKKWYRKFKIKLIHKPDDSAMLREVLERRIKHNGWPKPDLILVDGGKPQVGACLKALEKGGWNVPVFGLAKRLEEIITGNFTSIRLKRSSPALQLLQKIRDEAHRFALAYHHQKRKESLFRLGVLK